MEHLRSQTRPNSEMDIEVELARYIASACTKALPEEAEHRARLHLLDTLVAILSGRFLPAGKFGFGFAAAAGTVPQATLLGDGRRVSTEYAAFANAMAAHADETDDSHILGRFHPGCGVVPAALAVGETTGAGSEALLRAIALGYDIGARATMSLGFSNPRNTVFSTHAFGTLFGASASASALMDLSVAQAEAMLSFAVQQCSGLSYWNRDPDHVEKSFDFAGKSARNGVFAAHLAKAGMSAPDHPLTGARSYLEAFAESPKPDELVAGLGSRFEITRSTIKKWSVGSPLQSVLDAVGEVFAGQPTPGEQIAEIELRLPSNRIHIVDDRHMPAVCAQHLVAMATLRGPLSFAQSHDHALMTDPEVLELRRKIRLVSDESLTHARPERQSILTVRFADGTVRRHHAKVVRGTPDDPMTADEVARKASDILGPLQPDRGDRLIRLCLEEDFDVASLIAACSL